MYVWWYNLFDKPVQEIVDIGMVITIMYVDGLSLIL